MIDFRVVADSGGQPPPPKKRGDLVSFPAPLNNARPSASAHSRSCEELISGYRCPGSDAGSQRDQSGRDSSDLMPIWIAERRTGGSRAGRHRDLPPIGSGYSSRQCFALALGGMPEHGRRLPKEGEAASLNRAGGRIEASLPLCRAGRSPPGSRRVVVDLPSPSSTAPNSPPSRLLMEIARQEPRRSGTGPGNHGGRSAQGRPSRHDSVRAGRPHAALTSSPAEPGGASRAAMPELS